MKFQPTSWELVAIIGWIICAVLFVYHMGWFELILGMWVY